MYVIVAEDISRYGDARGDINCVVHQHRNLAVNMGENAEKNNQRKKITEIGKSFHRETGVNIGKKWNALILKGKSKVRKERGFVKVLT